MAALAVDLRARVLGDGIVNGQLDDPLGGEAGQGRRGEAAGQRPGGPAIAGEEGVIAAGFARGEPAEGAQQVGDGMGADGEDGGEGQQDEAAIGGSGEGRRQRVEDIMDRGGEPAIDAVDAAARAAGGAVRRRRSARMRARLRRAFLGESRLRAGPGILAMGASLCAM